MHASQPIARNDLLWPARLPSSIFVLSSSPFFTSSSFWSCLSLLWIFLRVCLGAGGGRRLYAVGFKVLLRVRSLISFLTARRDMYDHVLSRILLLAFRSFLANCFFSGIIKANGPSFYQSLLCFVGRILLFIRSGKPAVPCIDHRFT